MSKRGLLLVVSGPSGVGKGTILREYIAAHPNAVYSVSATTRKPRPGEIDKVHYYFMTVEDFKRRIEENGMLEYTVYSENYYGTPREYVEKMLDAGKDVILELEVQGAMNVKRASPDAVLIFIMPPSYKELCERLYGRKTEDEKAIARRLAAAKIEISKANEYHYVILNDEVQNAYNRLCCVIEAQRYKIERMENMIEEVLAGC